MTEKTHRNANGAARLTAMTSSPVPRSPEELGVEWLSGALRESGVSKGARVASLKRENLGQAHSRGGRLLRLRLRYDPPEPDAPATLIAKFHTAETLSHPGLADWNRHEIGFYQDVAPLGALPVPRCLHSALDPDSGASLLLLEDFGAAREIDELAGCSTPEAEHAVRQIARFHAAWWQSPKLAEFEWLRPLSYPPFVELFGVALRNLEAPLPVEIRAIGRQLRKGYLAVFEQLARPPITITHNDFQTKNLLFGVATGASSFAVVDFHLVRAARGVHDVALLLGTSLPTETRRSVEMELLRIYWAVLIEHGVTGYGFDQCLHDYRLGHLWNLIRLIGAIGPGPFPRYESETLQEAMLARQSTAIVDLDCGALLAE